MKEIVIHVMEAILGALLLILSLLNLMRQENATSRLIDAANVQIVEQRDLYQQSNNININVLSDENLYAVVMGYREYPITIDGTSIEADGTDYENYFILIKDGYYKKTYKYDNNHNIVQVDYTYTGVS